MSKKVSDVVAALQQIAPPAYAAQWDNVGLLVGGAAWDGEPVLLAIDLTPAVLDEAIKLDAQMIVAYHPPIFAPIKSLSDSTPQQRVILEAARRGIAIYSPHTALDAAPGGINDWLAEGLGAGDVRALIPQETLPESEQFKIVTFCPAEAVERVRNGLASIGAGRIGNYEQCSFEMRGTGTFLGGAGANPSVGKAGRLERVEEIRLEMVCPKAALALAIVAIREFHPYEEPPIEIHPLLPRPLRNVGEGRRVVLDSTVTLHALAETVKTHLEVDQVSVAAASRGQAKIGTIGLCAGSGGALLEEALRQGGEAFITGEMRHHDVLAAQAAGCAVILAGHTNTERPYLKVLRKRLVAALPGLSVTISKRDADPLEVV